MRPYRRAHPALIAAGAYTHNNDDPDAWILAGPAQATVALVGRPNVGKSTLFNRLVRRRQALMHNMPGVTRDRIEAQMGLYGPDGQQQRFRVRLVDTGGLFDNDADPLHEAMLAQTERAIAEADVVILVVDAQHGRAPYDEVIAKRLRRAGRRWLLAANKVDVNSHEPLLAEFYALGTHGAIGLSAEHARGIDELNEQVALSLIEAGIAPLTNDDLAQEAQLAAVGRARLLLGDMSADEDGDETSSVPAQPQSSDAVEQADGAVQEPAELDEAVAIEFLEEHQDICGSSATADMGPEIDPQELEDGYVAGSRIEWGGGPIRVAVVGRPNAGKSSLINAILGDDRLVAADLPGTTRDAVDTFTMRDDQPFIFIDTAGIRRRRDIDGRLEALTVSMALSSLDRADIAVIVLDGTQRPTDQDGRIAEFAHDKGCGVVIAANKWDLVENVEWRTKFPEAIAHDWPTVAYAPVVPTSAKSGKGLGPLFAAIAKSQRERHRRVTTGTLNRFFREVVGSHPPPVRGGHRPQLMYVSQPLVRPPTFVFSARGGGNISGTYRRYLQSALRQRFGFDGTPIWLKFRTQSPSQNPFLNKRWIPRQKA